MSKTVKKTKTHGILHRVIQERKERKLARCSKADESARDFDICPRNRANWSHAWVEIPIVSCLTLLYNSYVGLLTQAE